MLAKRSNQLRRLTDEGCDCGRSDASLDHPPLRPCAAAPFDRSLLQPRPSSPPSTSPALAHQPLPPAHCSTLTCTHSHSSIASQLDHTRSNQTPLCRRHAQPQPQRAHCDSSPTIVRLHPRHRTATTPPCATQTRTARQQQQQQQQQQPRGSGWRGCDCSLVRRRLPVSALRRVAVALMRHLATTDHQGVSTPPEHSCEHRQWQSHRTGADESAAADCERVARPRQQSPRGIARHDRVGLVQTHTVGQ